MTQVFNAAFKVGNLSISQQIAIIILLYKKGQKDDPANYRLITLTNLDYKILAYVLTGRIQDVLPEVIHPSQIAYMQERFLGTNICKVQDAINWAESQNTKCVVLFLDFWKAFDSVSHIFLWSLLTKMGFP